MAHSLPHNIPILIVGGGASGYFAALQAAESVPGDQIHIVEKGSQVLTKVRISGGGRCNVTHACFEPRELASTIQEAKRNCWVLSSMAIQ